MSDQQEHVQPSDDPTAVTATGTGEASDGATPPPPTDESASVSGLGDESSRQGSAPEGDAPYDLAGGDPNPTQERSPSGT